MNSLQSFIASKPMGFLTEADMAELIKLDRLCPVLVRCAGGRFTCAAQDAAHFIKCAKAGGDYVRDVSLPVGSIERAAGWVQEETIEKVIHRAAVTKAAGLLAVAKPANQAARLARQTGDYSAYFDESQCGGVFDGNQVTSDADPGL